VSERKATYAAVRRLYGITPVRSQKDVEEIGVRDLWRRLVALSTDHKDAKATLDRMASRALEHVVAMERVVI